MTAILLLLAAPILMWVVQSVMLVSYGLPIRLRIDAGDAPRRLRTVGRGVTQISLFLVILAYPLTRGESIPAYYSGLFPFNATAAHAGRGAAITALFLCVLFLAWLLTDQLRVAPHADPRRVARKFALVPLSAIFGAVVEEIVFRGIVMADFLGSPGFGVVGAVIGSSLVFASAHYVRSVKRYWTLGGHIMLGLLLSMAFLRTGNLWLAVGLHAGGILIIMGARPILKYRGPAWLTGASIYPYAGVVGIVGLTVLIGVVTRMRL